MTQHTDPNLRTGRHDDNPTSNEIRADIDQTRASVGSKIDELQARLDPNRLKEQAQETVQEMLSDTANSMTDYVRDHKDELISSVGDAARRNPLPTALIGLGVGWLLLESMGGNKSRDQSWEYERRNLRSRRGFDGNSGRNFSSQDRGPSTEEGYYSLYDEQVYGRSGYAGNAEFASPTTSNFEGRSAHDNGQQGSNPVAKAADKVKDNVEDMRQEAKNRASEAGHAIEEQVDEIKHSVGDAVGDVRRQAEHMGERTQQSLRSAGHQMQEWQDRARYEGQRRGRQVVRNLEDNPLTYGAVALAAGAALALLLPQTRTENRAFGETRDQLVERGQEVMETAKSHAQEVVDEVRPELEEKARQIISDVKETGKEAAKDVSNELRPVVDKAIAEGKDKARSAAQELGVDPDKAAETLTGKKPALNRDTMQGQWKQVKGEVKRTWGKLTDDELTEVEGDYEKLVGKIQTRYGYTRQRVEKEIDAFFESQKTQSRTTQTT